MLSEAFVEHIIIAWGPLALISWFLWKRLGEKEKIQRKETMDMHRAHRKEREKCYSDARRSHQQLIQTLTKTIEENTKAFGELKDVVLYQSKKDV